MQAHGNGERGVPQVSICPLNPLNSPLARLCAARNAHDPRSVHRRLNTSGRSPSTVDLNSSFHLVVDDDLSDLDNLGPLQVATDACSSGLGAVLLQNDWPIAYAARSLSPAEQNYSIIEKELLAVVFALTRFHFYTAGRRVTVLTDHQPLLGAARNILLRDNPRLDRLFDKIISYDLAWVYVPEKENHLPDFL